MTRPTTIALWCMDCQDYVQVMPSRWLTAPGASMAIVPPEAWTEHRESEAHRAAVAA